jgi:glycosyltransferase involved in cell wall biosynthesis
MTSGHFLARAWHSAVLRVTRTSRAQVYKLPYIAARCRSVLSRRDQHQLDLVFVLDERSKGWILEGICREIAQRYPGKSAFCHSPQVLPPARSYFFSHYALLPLSVRTNRNIRKSRLFVWYTHPRRLQYSEQEVVYALNFADKVFCPNSWVLRYLAQRGVRPQRLQLVLGGADPKQFIGHRRGRGAIGFSTAYYERKRPDRVLEIARAFAERQILLLGRGWERYSRFNELVALRNFTYLEVPYEQYPRYYAQMDVFVSPAILEGGPIPLLETMMSNAVPVASDTGFARDVIQHGRNGYIFDVDAPAPRIIDLISKALANTSDVRRTVEHLTWDSFAAVIRRHMLAPKHETNTSVAGT